MRIFLTGATGFLGGALARRLADGDHRVAALARDPNSVSEPGEIRWIRGDLADDRGLIEAKEELQGCDLLVHLAAVRVGWGLDQALLHRINVSSGSRLLQLASRVRRCLFVSSTAVYGQGHRRGIDETCEVSPSESYGLAKAAAEVSLLEAGAKAGVPITIIRPGIVYGPGDTYGMVAKLARLLARRRFLMIGKGSNRMNFLFIDDLVDGIEAALFSSESAGEDFIFAGTEPVTMRQFADTLAVTLDRKLPAIGVPEPLVRFAASIQEGAYRMLEISSEPFITQTKVDLLARDNFYDISKAVDRLGFSPRIGVEEGVSKTVTWMQAQGLLD